MEDNDDIVQDQPPSPSPEVDNNDSGNEVEEEESNKEVVNEKLEIVEQEESQQQSEEQREASAEVNGSDHDENNELAEDEIDEDYHNSTSSALTEERWEEMFQRLLDFKEIHGHCLVPNRYKEDLQLGAWVTAQRKNYKLLQSGSGRTTPMTPERAQRLIDHGFEWTAKNPRHLMWEVRFAELKDFKKSYGHAQVPIGWEQNVQLANWVSTQRQEYKNLIKGKTSRLNDKRVELLNSLGFAWELQRGGRRRRLTVSKNSSSNSKYERPKHPADSAEEVSPQKKQKLAEGTAALVSTPLAGVSTPKVSTKFKSPSSVRHGTARKRTTLKKKEVKAPEGSSKCILPGVAIMGGGRDAPARRSAKLSSNQDRTGRSDDSFGGDSGHNMKNYSPNMGMGAPNGPWQMLPNGGYQYFMGNGPGGFFPMGNPAFGMNPFMGPGPGMGQRGMDPPQYQGDGNDGYGPGGMSPQEMEFRRRQQQNAFHGGAFGGNNGGFGMGDQRGPYPGESVKSSDEDGPNQQQNNGGFNGMNMNPMNMNPMNMQQQMQMQMMQQQGFGGPWQGGMGFPPQGGGPFWGMPGMNNGMSENAAAAAAAQHLQAAAALTANMDERALPPALAPLASMARRMQQNMPGGGSNCGNGGGGSDNGMMNNEGSMGSNGAMNGPGGMGMNMNMRRGDPPADPPTEEKHGGKSGSSSSSKKRKPPMDGRQGLSVRQDVFDDADED